MLRRSKSLCWPLSDGREVTMETWEEAADFCCWQLERTGLASHAELSTCWQEATLYRQMWLWAMHFLISLPLC